MGLERGTAPGVHGEEAPRDKVGSAVFGGAVVAKGNAAVGGVWVVLGDDASPAGAMAAVRSIGIEGSWGNGGNDQ
jgi:hypothetical protein